MLLLPANNFLQMKCPTNVRPDVDRSYFMKVSGNGAVKFHVVFVLGDKVKEVGRGRRSQGVGTGRVKEWKGGNKEVRRKK